MSETTRLKLPFIMAAQAQKHVTHNEALLGVDALVQLSVSTRTLSVPPSVPVTGARYLVASSAGGEFLGHSGEIAAFDDGAWRFYRPKEGWLCWIADESRLLVRTDGDWRSLETGGVAAEMARLGIGTQPDATNRLSVKSDAALFTHDDVTPGTGHMRVTLNKSAAVRDAGLAFQTGFSSRALLGTFGSDAFTLRVSGDGAAFSPILAAHPGGKVALQGNVDTTAPEPIQMNGQVLVSADRLTVAADSGAGVGLHLSNRRSGAHGGYVLSATGTGAFTVADKANGERLLIGPTGNILPGADNTVTLGEANRRFLTIYTSTGTIQTSDRRDKDDIERFDTELALKLIDAIEPVMFRWKDEHGVPASAANAERHRPDAIAHILEPRAGRHAGFLAQDVAAALEGGAVLFGVWGLEDPADAESRQWLRPDQMIPILWEALRATRRELARLRL